MNLDELYEKYKVIGDRSNIEEINFRELCVTTNTLIEVISFCSLTELKSFLNNKTEDEIYYMPYWLKMLIFRLIILHSPNDIEILEWYISQLSWFASGKTEYINELQNHLLQLKK